MTLLYLNSQMYDVLERCPKGMQTRCILEAAMTVVIVIGAAVMVGASHKRTVESVREMEQMLGLTIAPPYRGLVLS